MNERLKWKALPSVLALIAIAAAIPRFWLGASQFVEYDGYWHVFIAQQDNWSRFWHDIYVNAHPPLYFLLLKAVLHLGHSFLIYRGISLITGIASVILMGLIGLKITRSRPRAYQTALAYGLSMPGIIVSCEVRSYMLSVFFVLLSFWFLLDTTGSFAVPRTTDFACARGEGRARFGFASAAILACLSHYFAFFYAGAAMLLLAGRFIARAIRRRPTSWIAELATSLPILATIATLYFVHAGRLAQIQGHLLPYYFKPDGSETVSAFLIRNWKNLLDWFSPVAVPVPLALSILVIGIAGAIVSSRDWTFPITAVMLAAIALAAVAGKYPFGGDLRQQFLLFPFMILCAAIFVEWIAVRCARALPGRGRLALNSLAVAAIVLVSVIAFRQYPKSSGRILSDRMALFDQLEPKPAAVYLDQFNLITFFIYHDQWRWTALDPPLPVPGVDIYRLTRGRDRMYVFRDTTRWNLEPRDPAVFVSFAQSLRAEAVPALSVFSVHQSPPAKPFADLRGLQRDIAAEAAASGVCVQKLKVNPVGWYGTFRPSDCGPSEIPPPQLTGTFDDTSPDIEYNGVWTHASFPMATGGSLSFSNLAQSTAAVTFEGTAITWVYTKAFNRGISEVKIDGISRGELDQYSPGTHWQSRVDYSGLPQGRHTLEITVTGRKQSAATDGYVDVDGFIVQN